MKSIFCINSKKKFNNTLMLPRNYYLFLLNTLEFALVRISCGLVFFYHPLYYRNEKDKQSLEIMSVGHYKHNLHIVGLWERTQDIWKPTWWWRSSIDWAWRLRGGFRVHSRGWRWGGCGAARSCPREHRRRSCRGGGRSTWRCRSGGSRRSGRTPGSGEWNEPAQEQKLELGWISLSQLKP